MADDPADTTNAFSLGGDANANLPPPAPGGFTFGAAGGAMPPPPPTIDWNAAAPGGGGGRGAPAGDDDDDDDDDDDEGEELPEAVLKRLMGLKALHESRDEIRDQYKAERVALEAKYRTQLQKLYDDRADIVSGRVDVVEEGAEPAASPEDGPPIVGVPNFWLSAMGHHELVSELIVEADVPCLEALVDVKCVDKEDMTGFTLEFAFKENAYFTNATLTKTYEIPNMLDDEEPILDGVEGCEIEWKPGMNLCVKEVKKKQRQKSGKKAGQVRTVTVQEQVDSFFNWFTPPKLPSDDEEEEVDEDEEDDVMAKFDQDYQVALAFRNQLIGNALLWYTGEAAEDDDDDEDDDEDDDDDDDEDDDDGAVADGVNKLDISNGGPEDD